MNDLHQVLEDHSRYWGERDLGALHLTALVRQFGSTCLVARAENGIRGYLIGFVAPDRTGYVHLIAVRDDAWWRTTTAPAAPSRLHPRPAVSGRFSRRTPTHASHRSSM